MHHHDDDASSTPGGVPGRLRTSVIAPRRGWPAAAAGRVAHLEAGQLYLGTTRQVAGLYPWLQPGSLPLQPFPAPRFGQQGMDERFHRVDMVAGTVDVFRQVLLAFLEFPGRICQPGGKGIFLVIHSSVRYGQA